MPSLRQAIDMGSTYITVAVGAQDGGWLIIRQDKQDVDRYAAMRSPPPQSPVVPEPE